MAELDIDNIPYITFFADRHSYSCRTATFTSATSLISQYEWPFAEDYWLTYKGLSAVVPKLMKEVKKEKYFFINRKGNKQSMSSPPRAFFTDCAERMTKKQVEDVKDAKRILAWEWEMKNAIACCRGTRFHLEMEVLDIASPGGVLNPFTGAKQKIAGTPNTTYSDNATIGPLEELEDGYYPELLIYYEKDGVGVCGQVDRAWIWTDKNGVRWYYSDDWKTNWDKRNKPGRESLKPPLAHLKTTKDNIYALQASIYAYMMELAGFSVAGFQITYVKDFKLEGCESRKLPYLKNEVEQMFINHFENDSEK